MYFGHVLCRSRRTHMYFGHVQCRSSRTRMYFGHVQCRRIHFPFLPLLFLPPSFRYCISFLPSLLPSFLSLRYFLSPSLSFPPFVSSFLLSFRHSFLPFFFASFLPNFLHTLPPFLSWRTHMYFGHVQCRSRRTDMYFGHV